MNEIMNFIPDNCWTILFVSIAGLILFIGVKILRSKKTNIDVHVGPVDVHVNAERASAPDQIEGTGDGNK